MTNLLNQLAQLVSFSEVDVQQVPGVAQDLMERAEVGAGRDPQEAQELRSAACAFLNVVR